MVFPSVLLLSGQGPDGARKSSQGWSPSASAVPLGQHGLTSVALVTLVTPARSGSPIRADHTAGLGLTCIKTCVRCRAEASVGPPEPPPKTWVAGCLSIPSQCSRALLTAGAFLLRLLVQAFFPSPRNIFLSFFFFLNELAAPAGLVSGSGSRT